MSCFIGLKNIYFNENMSRTQPAINFGEDSIISFVSSSISKALMKQPELF